MRPQPICEFGDFRLDAGRRRLERTNGEAVVLGAKAFDALVHLVEHAGEPLSRKTLIEALWPDTVVEENNLTQAISALRRALGDGYIVTLPGRGYQFVVAVLGAESGADAAVAEPLRSGGDPLASTDPGSARPGPPSDMELPSAVAQTVAARRWTPTRRAAATSGVALVAVAAAAIAAVLSIGRPPPAEPAVDATLTAQSPARRLAVLPFTNLRTDADTDYLGYALADELISRVSHLEGLILRPSSVVRQYHGQAFNPREVADALSVDYVLAGSYIQEDDTLRVNIELVNAATGASAWRERLEVPYDSVFRLQDRVTQQVARRLELDLTHQVRQRLDSDVASNPAAYHLYLRSLENPYSTEEGSRYAYDLLHRSVELDPTFAPALAALACRAFGLANLGFDTGAARHQSWREAEQTFERALALNPDQMHALTCQALLFAETGRNEEALEPLRHALSIQPQSSDVYISLGHVYRKAGLLDEAARIFERARALDPTNLRLPPAGLAYYYLGRYDEALELFALDPIAPLPLLWQGMTLIRMGQLAPARERFERVVRSRFASLSDLIAEAHLAYLDSDYERGAEAARALEAHASAGGNNGEEMYHFASLLTLFGEHRAGIRLLEQAVDRGFFPYPYLLVDPFFNPVRKDTDFQRVLADARARHEAVRTLVSDMGLPP